LKTELSVGRKEAEERTTLPMSSLLPWTSPQDQEKKREAVLEWAKKRREEREQAEKEMEEGVDIENAPGGSIFSFFDKESTRDKIKKKRKSRQIKQETGGLLSMLPFTKKGLSFLLFKFAAIFLPSQQKRKRRRKMNRLCMNRLYGIKRGGN